MFSLLSPEKKVKKEDKQVSQLSKVKEVFNSGRFPVVTTERIEDRAIAKVLGLVCCRGFDADEVFYGMLGMAMKKGAQGIIAYSENVAFHPDGSKYFSIFGTAVMFERESREDLVMLPSAANYAKLVMEQAMEEREYKAQGDYVSKGQMFSRVEEDDDPVLQRLLSGNHQG